MDGMTAAASPDDKPYVPEGYASVEAFLEEARKRFTEGQDADRENREAGLEDLRFLIGEQWDAEVKAARIAKGRPCLTINNLPQFVGQVVGDTRINKPSIKVRPAEDGDKKVAETRQGLIRHIEHQSRALSVYALAGEDQVGGGIGHFRINLEYADNDGFDQDIRIRHIPNPFAVVWDPQSVDPTGADARWCFVVDEMDRETFEANYPDAQASSLTVPMAGAEDWSSTDSVRVTEYWVIKQTERTIAVMLKAGEAQPSIHDITGREKEAEPYIMADSSGRPRVRKVLKKSACMYLTNGTELLEPKPYEYPISRLPIIKVTGRETRVGERRYRFGLVRFAKDPIRMKNLWRSSAAEWVGQAPKQQWLLHTQDEAEAARYRAAGKSGDTVLTYSGQIEPKRMDPPSAPAALLQEAALADQDIKDTTGLHDASLGMKSNETSGKAIVARERQGDVATYMYHDNLNAAIEEGGRVINDLIPTVYDTARTIVVVGEDDSSTPTRINDPGAEQVIDLKTGKYDIVVETGPSYSTKRVEAAESMMQFMQAVPAAAQGTGDLVAAAQDWPGADAIAKRLKRMLPPGLAEDEDEQKTPEQMQQRQQAMQQQAEQQGMQKEAAKLELAERAAKVEGLRADAAYKMAQPEQRDAEHPLDIALKREQVRKASFDADEARWKAELARLQIPSTAGMAAAKTERERVALAADIADLERKPLDRAHAEADLDAKRNPPPETAAV